MQIAQKYVSMFLICVLIIISTVFLLTDGKWGGIWSQEGFEIIPLERNPVTNKPINGYYQVDDTNMALIPYGFGLDPNDSKKIIPITKTAASLLRATYKPGIPGPGEPVPDGFYFITDVSLAVLPPNMKPNVKEIKFSDSPTKLKIYYNNGYVSATEYYKQQYAPATPLPTSLPPGVYFTDSTKTKLSFLPEGKLADEKKGYGLKVNPSLNLSTTAFNFASSNYRDISNNYDAQFHDSVDVIKEQNDITLGEVRVKDQNGNIIILPRPTSQSTVTYYKPGEYPFGASNYVPNYEDSVYLGSVGYRTQFGKKQCQLY
jgi:hypothetical protein